MKAVFSRHHLSKKTVERIPWEYDSYKFYYTLSCYLAKHLWTNGFDLFKNVLIIGFQLFLLKCKWAIIKL